ncbi:hypothetical protein [Qipengyuania nanhaisediminis]|uniref:hypothetical protein n=1 Tax=Qipengyuania nanhaisediminis TaxID=604088 RepID=UPI0038B3492D
MRIAATVLLAACLALPGWTSLAADPGTEPERVSRASAVDSGLGAVIMSVRSELYLEDTLGVFFLREGGSITNPGDVVRFERRQGMLSFGNDTLGFKVRAYQLRPGIYRLVAHGVSCEKVPAENERCLVEFKGIAGAEEISRPSRGYGGDAPRFEVRAGAVTNAGDFVLTARNTIEWAPIPGDELRRLRARFADAVAAPEPVIPEQFRLVYRLKARSLSDDWNRRY